MKKLKRVVLKEEFVEITGNPITAIILNQMIYLCEQTIDFEAFLEEESLRANAVDNDCACELTKGWFYQKAQDLSDYLMLQLTSNTIRNHLKKLIELGFILEKESNTEWDKSIQYRVDLVKVSNALFEKNYALDGYSFFDNVYKKIENCRIEKISVDRKNFGVILNNNIGKGEEVLYNNKKEKEKEKNIKKRKEKENPTEIATIDSFSLISSEEEVFEWWNSKGIIKHQKMSPQLRNEIGKKIKELGKEEVKLAIDRYAIVLHDKNYFFDYTWSLLDFLKRKNGISNFLDDGSMWNNYVKKSSIGKEINKRKVLSEWIEESF